MKPIVGIDIGGSFMKAGLVNNGVIVYNTKAKTEHKDVAEFFENVFKLIDEVLASNKLTPSGIDGIGIGIAGMVLADHGIVVSAVNLGLESVEVSGRISSKYKVPVKIGNDVGMFALAERAASGLDNLVYVAIGTGINAGVINRGVLLSGAHGASIEFGHSSMKNTGGTGILGHTANGAAIKCGCGSESCVESYVSGKAIMAAAKEHGIAASRPEDVFASDSFAALDIIDDFFHALTSLLLNICNIYRPQVIYIGGGLAPLVAPHIGTLQQCLASQNFGYKNAPAVEVKISELSSLGGVLGAALLFEKAKNKTK